MQEPNVNTLIIDTSSAMHELLLQSETVNHNTA